MRILFMGTPDFAKESLEKLYDSGYEIVGVVTAPDKPKGRGMKLILSPVKEYAIEKNLKVYQPLKVSKNDEFKDEIRALNVDLVVVVSYGKILPQSFLDIPRLGCINVHPSLLPKYRGPAPIQWSVLNGDKETGVSIMYLDAGMDTGDVIIQEKVEIDPDETTGELWNRLSTIGARMLNEVVEKISNGTVTRTKQPEEFVLAPMIEKEMAKIDWTKSAFEIKNLVRGLNPILGAYTTLNGKKIKFWKIQVITDNEFESLTESLEIEKIDNPVNGTILFANDKKGMFIKANDGIIKVIEIQGENSKKMPIGDFLRGNKVNIGEKCE